MDTPRPNPGSYAAQDMGCTCPVLDNNYGRTVPWPPDGWWIDAGCPVHARGERDGEAHPAQVTP